MSSSTASADQIQVAWLPSNAPALSASQIAGFSKAAQRALGLKSSLPKRARTHGSNRARTHARVHTTTAAKSAGDGGDSGDGDGDGPPSLAWKGPPSSKPFKCCSVHDFVAMVYSLGEEPLRSLHPDGTRLGNLLR